MIREFHEMDDPFFTGNLGGSLLQSVPLDNVLTFLGAIRWVKVDQARPWQAGGTVDIGVVQAQQVKINQITDITTTNYPELLDSTLVSSGVDPLSFGRLGINYTINFDQTDATLLANGANNPRRWKYLAALASLWAKLDNLVIQGSGSSNQLTGLASLYGSNTSASSGTTAANTRADMAKALANIGSGGQGGTALVGNKEAQQLLTEAYDGGRTEYGPGPLGGLIPFFDKVPFLRADVDIDTGDTTIFAVNLGSIVMFHTSGTAETLGFTHRSTDQISDALPLAATQHIVYGGHALNLTNNSAVYAITGVDVSAYA